MSYCELFAFKKNGIKSVAEYQNSHGYLAYIWDALYKRYVSKKNPWGSWLMDPEPLWALKDDMRLKPCERNILLCTFDNAMIKKEDFGKYTDSISEFLKLHTNTNRVNHLTKIIEDVSAIDDESVISIGWYGMSVCENPWKEWNEENDEYTEYDISTGTKHWFVDFAGVEDV